jgi:hypothetical protein
LSNQFWANKDNLPSYLRMITLESQEIGIQIIKLRFKNYRLINLYE